MFHYERTCNWKKKTSRIKPTVRPTEHKQIIDKCLICTNLYHEDFNIETGLYVHQLATYFEYEKPQNVTKLV